MSTSKNWIFKKSTNIHKDISEILKEDGVTESFKLPNPGESLNLKEKSYNIWHSLEGGISLYALKRWSGKGEAYLFCGKELTKEDLDKTLKKHKEEREAVLKKERLKRTASFKKFDLCKSHKYLENKGVGEYAHLFKIVRDRLVIPFRSLSDGDISHLQFIDEVGGKIYNKGPQCQDAAFVIGEGLKPRIILCEGVSTGLTLHKFCGKACSIVVCGSVIKIATVYRFFQENKDAKVVVAGENDEDGLIHDVYRSLKEKTRACIVMPPQEYSDFNDYSVADPEANIENFFQLHYRKDELQVLGYQNDAFLGLVVVIKNTATFNVTKVQRYKPQDLLIKAGFKEDYLFLRYLSKGAYKKFKDADPADKKELRKKLLSDIMEGLYSESLSTGVYERMGEINVGAFENKSKNYFLCGGLIWDLDKKELVLGSCRDFKEVTTPFMKINTRLDPTLNCDSGSFEAFDKLIHGLSWQEGRELIDAKLLIGWLVASPICGILDWRPHIWVTGPSHSGKSFVTNDVLNKFLLPEKSSVIRGLPVKFESKAGFKQLMRGKNVPLICDEMELSVGRKSSANTMIEEVVIQARHASSSEGLGLVQGTADQVADIIQFSYMTFFCSINYGLSTPQDRGRFCNLKLTSHRRDNRTAAELKCEVSNLLTEEFCRSFYNASIFAAPAIKKNIETFSTLLKESSLKEDLGHLIRSYGVLLGAYYTAKYKFKLIPVFVAKRLIATVLEDFNENRAVAEQENMAGAATFSKFLDYYRSINIEIPTPVLIGETFVKRGTVGYFMKKVEHGRGVEGFLKNKDGAVCGASREIFNQILSEYGVFTRRDSAKHQIHMYIDIYHSRVRAEFSKFCKGEAADLESSLTGLVKNPKKFKDLPMGTLTFLSERMDTQSALHFYKIPKEVYGIV